MPMFSAIIMVTITTVRATIAAAMAAAADTAATDTVRHGKPRADGPGLTILQFIHGKTVAIHNRIW